jgi:hypothetical protein
VHDDEHISQVKTCAGFSTLGERLCNQKSWLVMAIKKNIRRQKSQAWKGKSAKDP